MIYQPGDVLLYSHTGFYDWLIRVKSWSKVSHCEVVAIGGLTPLRIVGSRNGQGVDVYPFDPTGLKFVMRPLLPFDYDRANAWFRTVQGQPYDWLGLLAFESAKLQGRENGKMFCSEFATRYLRAGGIDPFNAYDADGIAPGEFVKSAVFTKINPAAVEAV